jgi:hypothetical protein
MTVDRSSLNNIIYNLIQCHDCDNDKCKYKGCKHPYLKGDSNKPQREGSLMDVNRLGVNIAKRIKPINSQVNETENAREYTSLKEQKLH